VLPLSDTNGHDWWDCTDPYDGMLSRQRQPECQLVRPDGSEVLVTASFVRGRTAGWSAW
jgi:hypothetical protein